ncbi:2-amino-4-hydroxy-6-hydroxymethyldihydropteridine pyrophosphokinase [Lampropedia cohaerens]|uniref:2-amino-4-hydroxy-6-hydroxymethyldihydropteridine pyrophosphokinase n=1 Tax=Lampropedia cohaerens TaxID=1610491 RepID=A0A0U1Q148_9BURK|nr:2-amino-4-hydroxy-6-hydroxymethyldihydropteridine diphosphokinase [Lampropedia cohaerens]KKW68488.1 2-amino-4-hydroxy-6-hydroxymethyldihydropteridine pyrophosphokinase [Lampropedia cohaerens]
MRQPPETLPQPAWIGLGANLGDAAAALRKAVEAIAALPGCTLEAVSPLYRTAPYEASGPDFLNAVIRIATTMAPEPLLRALQAIENDAGRTRPYRNAPRTLDLDLLWYCSPSYVFTSDLLTLPHPRWQTRAFVLRPLADIAPAMIDAELLQHVSSQQAQRLPSSAQWPYAAA